MVDINEQENLLNQLKIEAKSSGQNFRQVIWSPSGAKPVCASIPLVMRDGKYDHILDVWDSTTGENLFNAVSIDSNKWIDHIAWIPDEKYLTFASVLFKNSMFSNSKITICDVESKKIIRDLYIGEKSGPVFAWSTGESRVVFSEKYGKIYI